MPVFIAFAAFLLLVFGPRLGLGPWVVTTGPFGPKHKTPGQKSGVRTEALEMVLEHDSGQMEGTCVKGRFAGKSLSSLSRHELLQLLEELRGTDAKGALLLEAYLDRRAPGWREMTLRCWADEVEPITGPRSLGSAAPHTMGRCGAPPGCDVSLMCDRRLMPPCPSPRWRARRRAASRCR